MDKQTLALLADTEYVLLIAKVAHCEPDLWKNIMLLLCLFHTRMHLVVNISNDPVHMILLVLNYYWIMDLQRAKMKKKFLVILNKMIRAILGPGSTPTAFATSDGKKKSKKQKAAAAAFAQVQAVTAETRAFKEKKEKDYSSAARYNRYTVLIVDI
jgi:hypothetical protein